MREKQWHARGHTLTSLHREAMDGGRKEGDRGREGEGEGEGEGECLTHLTDRRIGTTCSEQAQHLNAKKLMLCVVYICNYRCVYNHCTGTLQGVKLSV